MERDSVESLPLRFVELTEERVVAFTCDAGRENVFTLQKQKFEILFEMGAMALLDGYYREAGASVAVALERFFEFYPNAASSAFVRARLASETYRRVVLMSWCPMIAWSLGADTAPDRPRMEANEWRP
jgi:hypothetical protein